MEDKLLAQGLNKKWKWIEREGEGEVENDGERKNISLSFVDVSGAA